MRKTILTIIISLIAMSTTVINATNNGKQELKLYAQAYDYVIKDSINRGKIIFISDSIVDIDRLGFSIQLKKHPDKIKIIKQVSKSYWFKNFYSKEIATLFEKSNRLSINSKSILFFSKVENGTLCADLFEKRKYSGIDYDWISLMNKCNRYLFFFNKEGKIDIVFKQIIIFN
jgi:hypothetical protein